MSALHDLAKFVRTATEEYRHGEAVTHSQSGNLHTTEIYAMPHKDEAEKHVTVDVGFIVVGFTEVAADKDRFVELLKAALAGEGEFANISASDFCSGPSYVTVGAWIGSQDLALRLFALIEHYGYGEVMLPRKLGIEAGSDQERSLMGGGMVYGIPNDKLRDHLIG